MRHIIHDLKRKSLLVFYLVILLEIEVFIVHLVEGAARGTLVIPDRRVTKPECFIVRVEVDVPLPHLYHMRDTVPDDFRKFVEDEPEKSELTILLRDHSGSFRSVQAYNLTLIKWRD